MSRLLKNEELKIPSISKDLVDYLSKVYPERTPSKNMTDREIWIMVGERQLARHLENLYSQQLERAIAKEK